MKIAVMGPGGVGGYFGARLAAAGNDVTFVARGAHLEAMRQSGLRLDSQLGSLHLNPVKVVADAREIAAADAVLFAVKMRDTESAAESLRALAAGGASVFTFQNGVESGVRIGRILGPGKVVEGAARISAHIAGPGVLKQVGDFAVLEFGEADGSASPRVAAFHAACVAAGINASVSENISRTLWTKFAFLAPMSGMTALTRGPIGPVRATPKSRALLQAAVEEAVALGVAQKTGLVPEDAARTMKLIDSLPPEMTSSMCHDLLAGKPIEVEGLSGAVTRLAEEHGLAAPSNAFIAAALAPFVDGKP
ncbi:MAG TPA: 2-dehydropantoate 2-reductase [Hyphomicrobiaceae bacterium]|jgi:2-dehydropantoate 2-reductase|nr:2-dehydropantoate 2-reductase [Hyphomicrobiaceae bacterium]